MNVKKSISIRSNPSEVYSYLMNIENRKDFIPALEEVILLDPIPLAEGSRYIEVSIIAGRPFRTTYEITHLVKGQVIGARTIKSVFPIKSELTLVNQGMYTVLTIDLTFKLSGLFRVASGIIRNIVDQQAQTILKKVKINLES